jgi:hypothetical protein
MKIPPTPLAKPNLAAFLRIRQKAFHADPQKFFEVRAI